MTWCDFGRIQAICYGSLYLIFAGTHVGIGLNDPPETSRMRIPSLALSSSFLTLTSVVGVRGHPADDLGWSSATHMGGSVDPPGSLRVKIHSFGLLT